MTQIVVALIGVLGSLITIALNNARQPDQLRKRVLTDMEIINKIKADAPSSSASSVALDDARKALQNDVKQMKADLPKGVNPWAAGVAGVLVWTVGVGSIAITSQLTPKEAVGAVGTGAAVVIWAAALYGIKRRQEQELGNRGR